MSKPANRKVSPNKKRRRKRRIRYDRIAILALGVIGIFALIWAGYRFFNPLLLKSDHYIAEYGETFDPYGNIKSVFLDSKTNRSEEHTSELQSPR